MLFLIDINAAQFSSGISRYWDLWNKTKKKSKSKYKEGKKCHEQNIFILF